VYAELLALKLKTNSEEEFAEDRSAYLDAAMLGGQEPALKRVMRTQTDANNICWSKIGFMVIG
jgi:hypothetical protein